MFNEKYCHLWLEIYSEVKYEPRPNRKVMEDIFHNVTLYVVGFKFFGLTYKIRARCKMLWGVYSAIYGEVNVSVEKCVEIKGDYVEK